MDIVVSVTESHIKRGVRASGSQCPVALAVKDATGLNPLVGSASVQINGLEAFLPKEIGQRIKDYDAGKGMEPFDLILPLRKRK